MWSVRSNDDSNLSHVSKANGVSFATLAGSSGAEGGRQKAISTFTHDPKCRVLLILMNTSGGAAGLTLTMVGRGSRGKLFKDAFGWTGHGGGSGQDSGWSWMGCSCLSCHARRREVLLVKSPSYTMIPDHPAL